MKKILITGSSGLCGSSIEKYLKQQNCYELFTTSREKSKEINHIHHDLFETTIQSNFPSNIDCLIHTASIVDEQNLDYSVIEKNLKINYNLINLIKKINVKHFINFSSISIYDKFQKNRVFEDSKIKPITPYGFSKLFSEILFQDSLPSNTLFTNLRLGYILGKPLPKRYFINKLKYQLQNKLPIKLINPNSTFFNFIDVDDINKICKLFIENPNAGTYNIVNDETPSLQEVFNSLQQFFPNESKTDEIFNQDSIKLDISNDKIKHLLNEKFISYENSFKKIFM